MQPTRMLSGCRVSESVGFYSLVSTVFLLLRGWPSQRFLLQRSAEELLTPAFSLHQFSYFFRCGAQRKKLCRNIFPLSYLSTTSTNDLCSPWAANYQGTPKTGRAVICGEVHSDPLDLLSVLHLRRGVPSPSIPLFNFFLQLVNVITFSFFSLHPPSSLLPPPSLRRYSLLSWFTHWLNNKEGNWGLGKGRP